MKLTLRSPTVVNKKANNLTVSRDDNCSQSDIRIDIHGQRGRKEIISGCLKQISSFKEKLKKN